MVFTMSFSASDKPFEIANLCLNCQKVQFRDDIPQLYQSGPHLELDRELLPEDNRGDRTGGFLDTEFALIDSYPGLPQLWRSSQGGCEFCSFLHEIVGSFVSEDSDINKMSECTMSIGISYSWATLNRNEYESQEPPKGLDAMLITAKFGPDDIENHEVTLRVCCHVESAYQCSISNWLRLMNRSNQEYCDPDSVLWMKQTLENCINSHEHDVFDRIYIPRRLIDVRPQTPRLTSREDLTLLQSASAPRYTALSYCWGSGRGQATTTLATLSDRRVNIPETGLPQVVRDAIQVTRALDIPFLWVDALCILQDDPSDWERQCTEMHNIYGSAYVTFCAANSRACDEGFLRQTGRIIRIPFQSRRAPDIEGSFLLQCKGLVDHFTDLRFSFLSNDGNFSRWNRRGWVFQEKVLSTRRLMFGRRDTYFLCENSRQRRGQDTVLGSWDHQVSKWGIDREPRDVYFIWRDVLARYGSYTESSVTNATDILPALSGLAQLFYAGLKDDYYAGHWSRTLYNTLLWFQSDEHTHSERFWSASFSYPRSEDLFLPSWSNLAKGYTTCIYQDVFQDQNGWHDCRSEIHLLHSKVLLVSANPFGPLTDCSLRLRGYTLNLSHEEVSIRGPQVEEFVRETFSLVVHGRCFGVLNFDCKPVPHDDGGKCVSEGEFGHFKLLLLMRCDYLVPKVTPTDSDSRTESCSEYYSSEEEYGNQDGSGEREQGEVVYSDDGISDQKPNERQGLGSQEDTSRQTEISAEESSATSHDGSEELQSYQNSMQGSLGRIPLQAGDIVRKGFGLIICPTENDGEFYRVGMFSPVMPRLTTESQAHPLDDLGGDIRELATLAQLETINLV